MRTPLKNYLKLKNSSPIFFRYAIVDTKDHLADQLFTNHGVYVQFENEYAHNDWNYRIVFCTVRKKNEPRFLEALAELENKMLLMGNTNYADFCNGFMEKMKQK